MKLCALYQVSALVIDMVIEQAQLMKIIREETAAVLAEKRIKQTEPSNPHHDSMGRFSSYKNSRSWSLEDKQKEMKSGKNVKPCGRGQRRKCKSPQELKWEGKDEPRSDSTSDYPRSHKRYKNDRMRKAERFPGYDQMKSLSQMITEFLHDQDEHLGEAQGSTKQCFDKEGMSALRARMFKEFLYFIDQYESAKRATPKA